MTSTIAFIGKSGNGKTTLTRAFARLLRKKFSNSSILLVDNDLSLELSDSFGIKTRNTIYGIKSGKHEYKTGIPEGMTKQEFIEWALEDIIVEVDENVDMIASWLITPKDCKCPSTKLMRDSLIKLIDRYDFVIFDCEYDLKYLSSLVDYPIDEAIIVSDSSKNNIVLSAKIADSSRKYAANGQLGIIINKMPKYGIMQFLVDDMKKLEVTYIDSYLALFPVGYGDGQFLFDINKNLISYAKDNGMKLPKREARKDDIIKYLDLCFEKIEDFTDEELFEFRNLYKMMRSRFQLYSKRELMFKKYFHKIMWKISFGEQKIRYFEKYMKYKNKLNKVNTAVSNGMESPKHMLRDKDESLSL